MFWGPGCIRFALPTTALSPRRNSAQSLAQAFRTLRQYPILMIIYGIKNCNTMQKTFELLNSKGVSYQFHDYKKAGLNEDTIRAWFKRAPWEKFINKQGLTWKKLSPEIQASLVNEDAAVKLMLSNTSMIRRPIIDVDNTLIFGLDEAAILQHC